MAQTTYTVVHHTLEEMMKIEEDFPNPEGTVEAGWYFYEEMDGAPIGPYDTKEDAERHALAQELQNRNAN